MGINKKHINKVFESNLDDWLASLGFIYPITNMRLDRFDKLYENYEYKLKDATIDVKAIISGTYSRKSKIIDLSPKHNTEKGQSFEELKMVARKGQNVLPQHIIDKMIKKHSDNSNHE